jgi:hypothetical protein
LFSHSFLDKLCVVKYREDRVFLGGDFNRRIGERGGKKLGRGGGDGTRKSKDKVENTEEKRLMKWIAMEKNKGTKNWKGPYIGSRGETVTDYGIVNEEAWEE